MFSFLIEDAVCFLYIDMAPTQDDLSEHGYSTDDTSPVSRSMQCRLSTYSTIGIDIDVDEKYNVLPFTVWMNSLRLIAALYMTKRSIQNTATA